MTFAAAAGMPAGDWATWTLVIVTVMLVVGTVALAFVAYRGLRRDDAADAEALVRWQREFNQRLADQDRERAEQQAMAERAQAVQIFVIADHVPGGPATQSVPGSATHTAMLFNASPLPIRNIVARWHEGTYPGEIEKRHHLLPGTNVTFKNIVSPGPGGVHHTLVGAVIEFDDVHGRRWRTTGSGLLDRYVDGEWQHILGTPVALYVED